MWCAAVLSRWWVGIVVGGAFLLAARRPRLRVVTAFAAPAALAVVAVFVIVQQARHHYPSTLDWPANFDRVNAVAWLAVGFIAAGVGIGAVETAQKAAVATLAPAELRGSAFGLLATIQSVGDLVASATVGIVWTLVAPSTAFGLASAVMVVALIALVVTRGRRDDPT